MNATVSSNASTPQIEYGELVALAVTETPNALTLYQGRNRRSITRNTPRPPTIMSSRESFARSTESSNSPGRAVESVQRPRRRVYLLKIRLLVPRGLRPRTQVALAHYQVHGSLWYLPLDPHSW